MKPLKYSGRKGLELYRFMVSKKKKKHERRKYQKNTSSFLVNLACDLAQRNSFTILPHDDITLVFNELALNEGSVQRSPCAGRIAVVVFAKSFADVLGKLGAVIEGDR